MAGRPEVISLYKCLIREGSKFFNYNLRSYTQRKVRDAFREKKTITDKKELEDLISVGRQTLAMLQRQVLIDNLYKSEKLVIDKHN